MNIHEQLNSQLGSKTKSNNTRDITEGEAYWQEHIERCHESDLSKAEYARKHELNYAKFLYWHKRGVYNQRQNKLLPIKVKPTERLTGRTDKLCSINIAGHELQIYDLLALDHLLDKLNMV